MDIKERVTEFVNKYPNLFTEDKDFWVDELEKLLKTPVGNVSLNGWGACPFCGFDKDEYRKHQKSMHGDAAPHEQYDIELKYDDLFLKSYYMYCKNCGALIVIPEKNERDALEFWNRRAG